MNSPGNPNFYNENNPGVKFSVEHQPESQGRPKGSRNRSTIARKVLEMRAIIPDEMLTALRENFPDISNELSAEEIATIVMLGQAIAKKDVNAYKAIMDSAYGAPKQEIENLNTNVSVLSNDPLNAETNDSPTEDISTT